MATDGAGAVRGAVGTGLSTDYAKLGDAHTAVRGVVNAGGLDHKAAHLALAGTAGLKGVQAGVEKLAQLAAAPSTLEFRDPACVNFVQRHGVQVMQLFPTVPNDGHQVCLLQLLQVLSYGLACHVHVFTQRGQCLAALPMQQVRQTPAARVGKRFENFVDVQQPGPLPMPCTHRSIVDRGQRMNVGAVSAQPRGNRRCRRENVCAIVDLD